MKSEVCLSPDHLISPSLSPQSSTYAASSSGGTMTTSGNIKFSALLPQKWCKVYDANLQVNINLFALPSTDNMVPVFQEQALTCLVRMLFGQNKRNTQMFL